MKLTRLQAFTIMEVTVAMLLTGLAIGITYAVYSIVLQSYSAYGAKNDNINVLFNLDHILKRDFDRADTIIKDTAGLSMKIGSQTIKYAFYPDFITRESTKIDTFKVQTQDWITAFENVPLNELQTHPEQNRVDELNFRLILNSDTIPYHYYKLYSSENLIQRNPNALN